MKRYKDYEMLLLKSYLKRYERCKKNEKSLIERVKKIRAYKDFPLKVSGDENTGGGRSSKISNQPLSIILEIESLEERLRKQYKNSIKTMESVLDIISYLPEESSERNIFEMLYIDVKSVYEIADEIHYSRATIFRKQKIGLIYLLKFRKIRKLLKEYAEKIEKQNEILELEDEEN